MVNVQYAILMNLLALLLSRLVSRLNLFSLCGISFILVSFLILVTSFVALLRGMVSVAVSSIVVDDDCFLIFITVCVIEYSPIADKIIIPIEENTNSLTNAVLT